MGILRVATTISMPCVRSGVFIPPFEPAAIYLTRGRVTRPRASSFVAAPIG